MRIARLRLVNFGPFRGEHILDLDATSYAIVAEHDGDPLRSNWAGKSMLLEAIRFAITGEHRHRLEEEWLSTGTDEGEVELFADTGLVLRRFRKATGGTQLEVGVTGGEPFVKQQAQLEIERALCLWVMNRGGEPGDLETTSFLGQGRIAAAIKGDPASRTALITRWLDLHAIDEATRYAQADLKKAHREIETVKSEILLHANERREALTTEPTHSHWEPARIALESRIEKAKESAKEWSELLDKVSTEEMKRRLLDERAKLLEEGRKALLEYQRIEVMDVEVLRETRDTLKANLDAARKLRQQARIVARGQFDGCCPITSKACPIADEINTQGVEAEAALAAAESAEHVAEQAFEVVDKEYREACARANAKSAARARVETIKKRVKEFEPIVWTGSLGLALSMVQAERDRAVRDLALLESLRHRADAATEKIAELSKKVESLEARLVTAREASAVLVSAQRSFATLTMSRIAGDANRILREAGVTLRMTLSWERETKEIASDCEVCGAVFPRTAKAKKCEECGADRGVKRTKRFDVDLSDRSGAAEDLAGLAFALAGGSYLRSSRGSPWSVVMLDEPAAQLDRAHRKAMSAHLPGILRAARVEQAFVVSHSPDSVASLPGRIVVRRSGRWSTVEVAAS